MACPYDAIRWDPERGVVSKCHLCHERIDQGLEPACVATCFAGALTQVLVRDDDGPAEAALEHCSREAPGLVDHPGVAPSIRFVLHRAGRPAAPGPGRTSEGER
jgi:Fe-S-cluster-containing dehydrogenase component